MNNGCFLKLAFTTKRKMRQTQQSKNSAMDIVGTFPCNGHVCTFPCTKPLLRKFFSHSIRQITNRANSEENGDKLMKNADLHWPLRSLLTQILMLPAQTHYRKRRYTRNLMSLKQTFC